jgi:dihydrofolate reductase
MFYDSGREPAFAPDSHETFWTQTMNSFTGELVLIAAMARNGVIGHQGDMPWRLPADLKHFRAVTASNPLIMGRKTFDSIGKPLPGRRNIVISRSSPSLPEAVELAESLDAALLKCADAEQVMIIGGGEIYRQAMPLADRMELTLIDTEPAGDTHFPDYDVSEWSVETMQACPPDRDNAHRLVFLSLKRKPGR